MVRRALQGDASPGRAGRLWLCGPSRPIATATEISMKTLAALLSAFAIFVAGVAHAKAAVGVEAYTYAYPLVLME